MHHIQRKILNALMYTPTLTYAQMRPKGVESNHFAYHLEQLLKAGLVAKQDRDYSLTSEGMALADRVSHADMNIRKQPHIVTTLYVTNAAGRVLLYKHAFQPYLNLYGFPQGRLHFEENILEAAKRELQEKTGLDAVELEHRGMAYISAKKGNDDISKLLSHVFVGSVDGEPELSKSTQKGGSSWGDPSSIDGTHFMPGFWELKKLADTSTGLFFAEIASEIN